MRRLAVLCSPAAPAAASASSLTIYTRYCFSSIVALQLPVPTMGLALWLLCPRFM